MLSELKEFEPKNHPLRSVFRRAKIKQWTLANRFGVSQSLMSQYLGGRRPIPAEIETELNALAEQIRA